MLLAPLAATLYRETRVFHPAHDAGNGLCNIRTIPSTQGFT